MPICQVCQKNQTNIVVNSQLSPSSNAYCKKCYQVGLEPWSDFIGTCFCLHILDEKDLENQFSNNFVEKMLKFHNKSKDDIFQAVKKTCDAINKDMLEKGK